MDTSTGEIREFSERDELEAAIRSGTWVELGKMPKKNCRFCHGLGHLGLNVSTGKNQPCRCVKARK